MICNGGWLGVSSLAVTLFLYYMPIYDRNDDRLPSQGCAVYGLVGPGGIYWLCRFFLASYLSTGSTSSSSSGGSGVIEDLQLSWAWNGILVVLFIVAYIQTKEAQERAEAKFKARGGRGGSSRRGGSSSSSSSRPPPRQYNGWDDDEEGADDDGGW